MDSLLAKLSCVLWYTFPAKKRTSATSSAGVHESRASNLSMFRAAPSSAAHLCSGGRCEAMRATNAGRTKSMFACLAWVFLSTVTRRPRRGHNPGSTCQTPRFRPRRRRTQPYSESLGTTPNSPAPRLGPCTRMYSYPESRGE